MRSQPGNVTPTIMNHGFCFERNCQHLAGWRTGASPLWLTSKHLQQLMFHPDVSVFSCVASSGANTDQVTPVESRRWLLRDKMQRWQSNRRPRRETGALLLVTGEMTSVASLQSEAEFFPKQLCELHGRATKHINR